MKSLRGILAAACTAASAAVLSGCVSPAGMAGGAAMDVTGAGDAVRNARINTALGFLKIRDYDFQTPLAADKILKYQELLKTIGCFEGDTAPVIGPATKLATRKVLDANAESISSLTGLTPFQVLDLEPSEGTFKIAEELSSAHEKRIKPLISQANLGECPIPRKEGERSSFLRLGF